MTVRVLGAAHAESLRRCTVRIEVAGEFRGSGFLAAPGLVVTCAHVVRPGPADGAAPDLAVRHGHDAHPVAPAAVRAEPADPGPGPFHAYPDLALLPVPTLADRPAAPLAAAEAEPGTVLTALGFSTHTPVPGAHPDTVALRVTGPSGPFVRVGGTVQQGFSGSPLAGPDGRVYGVLKGSRAYDRDLGGWYTPLAALTALLGAAASPAAPPAAAALPPPPPPTDAQVVEALMAFPVTARADGRFDLLERMGEHLGLPHAFEAEERADRRDHLGRIVRRCRHHRDGRSALRALYTAMAELAPHDGALDRLHAVVGRVTGGWEGR